jgi:CheY-like chemotaxis protein
VLDQIRNVSRMLRPSVLDDLGLEPALAALTQEFERRTGIRVDCEFDLAGAGVTEELQVAIYRVVQEALTNVARHSGAKRALVRVARQPGGIEVIVEDNGRGAATNPTPHLGLLGCASASRARGNVPRRHAAAGRIPRGGHAPRAAVVRIRTGSRRMTAPMRVVLVDDQELIRAGVRKVLEGEPDMAVVGEAKDGQEMMRVLRETEADVVVLDLNMPGRDGFEALRDLNMADLSVRVLVLSLHDDPQYVGRAVREGAHGYLLKDSAVQDLPLACAR